MIQKIVVSLALATLIRADSYYDGVSMNLYLGPCDPAAGTSNSKQHFTLNKNGWGANNTIMYGPVGNLCLDVTNYEVEKDGAAVNVHSCCHQGSQACRNPTKNYNQQWGFAPTHGKSHLGNVQVYTKKRVPGLCLTQTTTMTVVLEGCDPRQAPSPGPPPPPLCLTTEHHRPTPAPSPTEPNPPGWKPTDRACTLPSSQTLPFCNTSVPMSARVADLIGRMTLAEKLPQFIGGIGGGTTPPIPRLGVPKYQYHSEGLHGIRTTCNIGPGHSSLYSTLFPQVTGMAATGNISLIRAMADHMADEARAVNNILNGTTESKGGGLNYWGPTMNIGRDPRWGRLQESVSEDPWLNGAYSIAFVEGLQAPTLHCIYADFPPMKYNIYTEQGTNDGIHFTKIAACCKHFFAYSLEDSDGANRHNFDAEVSKRDLAETYLPPFGSCLAANPEQVMCSYNSVNGVPTCLDGTGLNGYLRQERGWEGLVVSDCDAVADAYKTHKYVANASMASGLGIRAGCDQDCGSTYKAENLKAAMAEGFVTEAELDIALTRAMRMRFNLGMFDPIDSVSYKTIGASVLDSKKGQELALRAAEEAIILLQNAASNDDAHLPLSVNKKLTLALIGPMADDAAVMMARENICRAGITPFVLQGGKSDYCPRTIVTIKQGIDTYLQAQGTASNIKLIYHSGSPLAGAVKVAESADLVIAVVGGVLAGEAKDRSDITLPNDQQQLLEALINVQTSLVLVMVSGEPIAIDTYMGRVGSIVHALEGGQAGGTALANILFGSVSPSGTLPFTMYPANFIKAVKMSDMTMRPNVSAGTPGRTYRFYSGTPLFPFGFGLTYEDFDAEWDTTHLPPKAASVDTLTKGDVEFTLRLTNKGNRAAAKIQGYLSYTHQGIPDPPKRSLFAMNKVLVPAQATVRVTLKANAVPGACVFCTVAASNGFSPKVDVGTIYKISIGDGANDSVAPLTLTATV